MKEQKTVQRNHLPESKNLEIESALNLKIKKAKVIQDKKEKEGKYYVLPGVFPKTLKWVANDKDVQESIKKYLKKIEQSNSTLIKIKL